MFQGVRSDHPQATAHSTGMDYHIHSTGMDCHTWNLLYKSVPCFVGSCAVDRSTMLLLLMMTLMMMLYVNTFYIPTLSPSVINEWHWKWEETRISNSSAWYNVRPVWWNHLHWHSTGKEPGGETPMAPLPQEINSGEPPSFSTPEGNNTTHAYNSKPQVWRL